MKLIVLRGNSGSGKSSVAKAVRAAQSEPMAYIEQDYVRRILFQEPDTSNGLNIELLKQIIIFSLEHSYHVIAEGIFRQERYESMFREILEAHPKDNFFFYFDISFEETIRRHQTKPNKHEFGEKELSSWYREKDLLRCIKEEMISEEECLDEIVGRIFKKTSLSLKNIR